MFVRLAIFSRVIVDDTIDPLDIDSSRCDICSDESHASAFDEFRHRSVSLF